ncbi:MAG: HAMP domain-containing histidine kinase [Ruminococcaceae bacterium]|nr:HAMP domain-containing histidine kinase [Oscillospiraceae bacterium]
MKHLSNKFESIKNEKTNKISIKWKIVFALFLFTGIIILILWLFQVVFLGQIYESIKYRQLESTANSILKSTDPTQLENRCERASTKYELCILIYDLNTNEIICTKDNLKHCWIHRFLLQQNPDGSSRFNLQLADRYRQEALKSGGKAFIVNQIQFETDFIGAEGVKHPIPYDDENKSVMMVLTTTNQNGDDVIIFLNSILEPVSATVETLNSMLLFISILILLIATLVGLGISYHIAKPITKITSQAKELAKGNYNLTFEESSYKEINDLSITLNHASTELSKVDALKNDLISNISHDLRTPLTLISGYAEMMRDLPDESTPENLQIIIDEADRMKNLVNDVLDISRIQSGTNQFDMEDFPLTNCIESELTRYNKLRDKEGYTIGFEYDSMVTLHGDQGCIMRAVYNLVNNAVTHAGADKLIVVRQEVDSKHKKVRISVTDNGEGIDPDKLELIWERYYKVDQTHKRAQIGTGLGLSIVKNIVTAHGGTYGVTSTKGQGSTFYFELEYLCTEPILPNEENGGI